MFCRGFLGYGFSGFGRGGAMFPMMFGLIIFLVLVLFVFKAMKVNLPSHFSKSSDSESNASALKILSERYAKGEINEEEYTKMKTLISKKN